MGMIATPYYLSHMKTIIPEILGSNFSKKIIVYTNTASKAEHLKQEMDQMIDLESLFEGDSMLIHGSLQAEVKLISAPRFNASVSNPRHFITTTKFYHRFLIATATCIGAGLDSSDIYCVIRVGFPTSILDMVQEMGRCGWTRSNDGTNPTDKFHMYLDINDFVYLNERLKKRMNLKQVEILVLLPSLMLRHKEICRYRICYKSYS